MDLSWLFAIPLWLLAMPLFLLLLLVPLEVGFQLGKRRRRAHPDAKQVVRSDVTLTSMLALLGLMLAFTYSFSMSRADLRKKAFINEVNAISTAFVRADLLPEPGRTELRDCLYDYARSRLVTREMVSSWEQFEEVVQHSLKVQAKIWPATKSAVKQEGSMPEPQKALLVQAVNDVLDAHTSRMAVIYDRLPSPVLALLLLIAASSLGLAAYHASLSGHRYRWRLITFAVILSALIVLILDFDFITHGFIRINHESLASLIQEMEAALLP